MSELRAATRSAHHRIDHHPVLAPLVRQDISLAQYKRVLQCMMAIHIPLHDHLLAAQARMGLTEDFQISPRPSWLYGDFHYFGLLPDADVSAYLDGGWQRTNWPDVLTPAQLVGALYVVEGSTLGGQVIARLLKEQLGVKANAGASFFAGHGKATPDRWTDFVAFAYGACPGGETETICQSALDTFAAFERALTGLVTHPRTHS